MGKEHGIHEERHYGHIHIGRSGLGIYTMDWNQVLAYVIAHAIGAGELSRAEGL